MDCHLAISIFKKNSKYSPIGRSFNWPIHVLQSSSVDYVLVINKNSFIDNK